MFLPNLPAAQTAVSGTIGGTLGQTFNLTAGVDTISGTSGNDTIVAVLGDNGSGVANVETLGAFDTIDGGAGTDSVSLGATTKAITMGAGNDTVTVTANFGTGGTVDAGDGTGDTIKMTEALAANDSLSASSTFAGKISGFEKLSLTTVTGSKTVNLANLDAISFVTTTAATALTLDNMLSGGTVQLTAAANAVTTNVKDAALGGHVTDVINLKLYAATSGANVDYGTFTAANVETVNIESTRSGTIVTADTNALIIPY